MIMKHLTYEEARSGMQVGDVIAFGGSSHFAGIIKAAIRAEVSHIGIILHANVTNPQTGVPDHELMDSTARRGVAVSRLRERVQEYDGEVWWLPLRQDLRETQFDSQAFGTFLTSQEGKKYDQWQAAGSAIDVFDHLPRGLNGPGYNREDFTRFFCSELVAAGLKAGGMLPQTVNTSEATPIDVCRWNIYAPEYYLLKGHSLKEISGYNSLDIFQLTHAPKSE